MDLQSHQMRVCRGGFVLEKLLNEINVCHEHSPAAVSLATELVHRITVNELASFQSSQEAAVQLTHLTLGHQEA